MWPKQDRLLIGVWRGRFSKHLGLPREEIDDVMDDQPPRPYLFLGWETAGQECVLVRLVSSAAFTPGGRSRSWAGPLSAAC